MQLKIGKTSSTRGVKGFYFKDNSPLILTGLITLLLIAVFQQFLICEEELGKALQLASDFKHKIDEEEVLKQDILTQLLSEKASKTNIQNTEKERWKIVSTCISTIHFGLRTITIKTRFQLLRRFSKP